MRDECKELAAFHYIIFVSLLVTLKFEDDINNQLNKEHLKQIKAQLVPIRYSCILRVLLLQPYDIGHEIRSYCKEVLYRFWFHMLEKESELHRCLGEVLVLVKFHVDRFVLGWSKVQKSVLVA